MNETPVDTSTEPVGVLLVDDEPRNLLALEVALAAPDRRLVHARSGDEACRALLHADFAVVVLDINMPGMDGFDTATLIRGRERSRATPIVFLTASADPEGMARGYALGAVDYLAKPFDPTMLQAKVAVFVDLFRKTEEVRRLGQELAVRARLEGALLAVRTAEHELGNQLAAASGHLQLLRRGGRLSPEDLRRTETALLKMGEAADTVRRLRELSSLGVKEWGAELRPTLDLEQEIPTGR